MNYRPTPILIDYLTALSNRRYRLGYAIHRRAQDPTYPQQRIAAMRGRLTDLALQINLIERHLWEDLAGQGSSTS